MLTYVVGDLLISPARVLVNTVSTVGVMGKGTAKRSKTVYAEMFTQYQELCKANKFSIGQLWLHETQHTWILNFPTKQHWRSPSKPSYLEQGLKEFKGIASIAFPKWRIGLGGTGPSAYGEIFRQIAH